MYPFSFHSHIIYISLLTKFFSLPSLSIIVWLVFMVKSLTYQTPPDYNLHIETVIKFIFLTHETCPVHILSTSILAATFSNYWLYYLSHLLFTWDPYLFLKVLIMIRLFDFPKFFSLSPITLLLCFGSGVGSCCIKYILCLCMKKW